MIIHGVQPLEAKEWWGTVDGWIQNALDKDIFNTLTVEEIHRAVEIQENQMWVIKNPDPVAVVITKIVTYPKSKALIVVLCSGSGMRTWANHLTDLLRKFASWHECTHIAAAGRAGWKRALKGVGAKERATLLTLEI
jgi:antitoxin component HigA of HigAB toxin-antitoxin module